MPRRLRPIACGGLGYAWSGLVGTLIVLGGSLGTVQAVQFPDGTVAFEAVPRLLEVKATRTQTSIRPVTYYITIDLPEASGEALGMIEVSPYQAPDDIRFNLEATRVLDQQPGAEARELAISTLQQDPATGSVRLTFVEPPTPGTVIKLALQPDRNPDYEGVYLLGVTVAPAGERVRSQFLGYGRLHFYRPDNSPVRP